MSWNSIFVSAFVAALLLAQPATVNAEVAPGKLTGGVVYSLPQWFKSSFLEFDKDIEEARATGKHVLVFMHLEECPYCDRMLEENFTSGETREFIEANFEVIGLDVRGSLDVAWIDGATYVERELAEHLKAFATPTLVFLDLDGNNVLQLTGYRDPAALRYALDYVQGGHYKKVSFSDFQAARAKPTVYSLREHPLFTRTTYFKDYDGPLAILFEDRHCGECDRFHEKTLNRPNVLEALKPFLFVRLDGGSDRTLVDLEGNMRTPAQWMAALGLTYRPSLVLFNDGREMFRADGRLYHHHLSEALHYVSDGYREYDTIDDFKTAYREALMARGIDIDFSE